MSGCSYFDQKICRSCELMDVSLETQLATKTKILHDIMGIEPEAPERSSEWHFRDKIKLSVGGTLTAPTIGILPDLHAPLIELPECRVQADSLNRQIPRLKEFLIRWKIPPYDVHARRGEIKGLILSWSPQSKQLMLRFVLRSKESLDRIRQGLKELTDFAVVSVNIQPTPHALLEGEEEITLTEQNAITHHTGVVQLAYSPQSFMQTNLKVADSLYKTATEWLSPWRGERALDLFCGAGGFALHLTKAGFETLGVEINPSAVALANTQAQGQKLAARFITSPSERIETIAKEWKAPVIVVNPPRRGLAASRSLIERLEPKALLYSSCSWESLKIDIDQLQKHYAATRTKIFDMFPYTHHFESLTLLVRR